MRTNSESMRLDTEDLTEHDGLLEELVVKLITARKMFSRRGIGRASTDLSKGVLGRTF